MDAGGKGGKGGKGGGGGIVSLRALYRAEYLKLFHSASTVYDSKIRLRFVGRKHRQSYAGNGLDVKVGSPCLSQSSRHT